MPEMEDITKKWKCLQETNLRSQTRDRQAEEKTGGATKIARKQWKK